MEGLGNRVEEDSLAILNSLFLPPRAGRRAGRNNGGLTASRTQPPASTSSFEVRGSSWAVAHQHELRRVSAAAFTAAGNGIGNFIGDRIGDGINGNNTAVISARIATPTCPALHSRGQSTTQQYQHSSAYFPCSHNDGGHGRY